MLKYNKFLLLHFIYVVIICYFSEFELHHLC